MIGWLVTIGVLYWLLRTVAKAERKLKNRYYTLKTAKYIAWSWIFGFIYMVVMLAIKIMNMID